MKSKLPTLILLLFVIGAMILLLTSCMTSDKATGYLSAHRETAASYCAAQFPVKADSIVVTKTDTVTEHATERDLTGFTDSIVHKAYNEKQGQVTAMENYIDALEKQKNISDAAAAGLRNQLKNIKPVDTVSLNSASKERIEAAVKACNETTTRITKENTAKSEAASLRGDRLQGEKDDMTGKRDWWRKWFFILLGIDILYIALRWAIGKFTFAGNILGKFIK